MKDPHPLTHLVPNKPPPWVSTTQTHSGPLLAASLNLSQINLFLHSFPQHRPHTLSLSLSLPLFLSHTVSLLSTAMNNFAMNPTAGTQLILLLLIAHFTISPGKPISEPNPHISFTDTLRVWTPTCRKMPCAWDEASWINPIPGGWSSTCGQSHQSSWWKEEAGTIPTVLGVQVLCCWWCRSNHWYLCHHAMLLWHRLSAPQQALWCVCFCSQDL